MVRYVIQISSHDVKLKKKIHIHIALKKRSGIPDQNSYWRQYFKSHLYRKDDWNRGENMITVDK